MAQISYGSITIVDTNDIQRFYVQYAKNNSSAAAPQSGWSQDRPTWQNGTYIWQRTVAKREGVALTASDYGNPVCITGEKGDTGQQGNTGKGISSIATVYCNYGSGTPPQEYSSWSSSVPEYDKDKPNYWVKTTVNYTSGDPSITIYKDLGITEAAEKANLAAITAQSAEAHSIEAISIADSKNKIYYSSEIPTTGNYINGDTLFKESSAGTVMYVYDDTYTDPATGHWKQQQFEENAISDLAITNAKIKDLHGDKITANTIAGNKIVAHDITAVQLATDAIKSTNYKAGTAPYSTEGTFLDLANGNIYSPVFGINATDNNQGAFIKGSIYAYDGRIGENELNYWYIGNYWDYNQLKSAYIKGNGTATIQLGDTSTWRLNTNRIHTAWNENKQGGDDYKLHYPVYSSKYWDMGLHVPVSKTDKFIYIRNSSSSTALSNLQSSINDQPNGTNNYWNYRFYVTSEGNLYAKNLYILDDNGGITQIAGTSAPYLLKAGGDISGNLTIGGTLKISDSILNKNGNNITLQTNLASTTAATLTGDSTSPILIGVTGTLPTSKGGTGNTSYNAGGIVYADNSSPKKLLSTATGTSGYLLKSNGTGAPTWVDPGTLTVAAAMKATQDEDGNVIKTTYLKLIGGNITGPVSFGDSVTIDDLNTGTLIVTGNASFTNNIQANTINNVEVGLNPKFTDTVTTITTEGSGNAITAIEATNGALKAIKGSTFLMGITSQNVINALGYTPYNAATNPSGYTTNTGTVTSVRVQASSPLQSSVNTAQNSSLNTTISFINQNANVVLAGPSSGNAAAPTFRTLVAADIPSLTKSKISDFPTSLKNPNSLSIKIFNGSSTATTTAYDGSVSNQSIDVAGTNAITSINSTTDGKLQLTLADGSKPDPISIKITATTSDSSSMANKLNLSQNVGSTSKPVYFDANTGLPKEINYTIQSNVPQNAVFTDTKYSAGTGLSLNGTTFSNSGVTGVKGNNEGSYRTGQVNLTAANIGAFESLSYQRGTTEVGIRPLVDQTRANRLAFLPADQIIIEKTTDGGTTWEDAGISDSQKCSLFVNGTSIPIPLLNGVKSTQCGIRITITGMKYDVPQNTSETQKYNYWNDNYVKSYERYFNVREWWFWISANSDTIRPEIYCSTGASPNNWKTVFNTNFGMTGWSDSDWIRAGNGKTFGGGITQTGNYWNWRLIFWSQFADGKTVFNSTTAQTISTIKCYGDSVWIGSNGLATRDHLYSWDNNQNATFPAHVTATEFIGNLAWSKITNKPITLSGYGITDSILKWQTSTTAATNIYDFGVYVAHAIGGAAGPTNENYYTMLNIPYRKAFGNTKADYGWSIAGSANNDKRLFYRTSDGNTWGDWVEIAHINAGTAVGSATQPVYVSSTGVVTACTSYANASVNHATSADSATSATKIGNSAIWLYTNNNNEINFGGTNTGTLIYMGYRATDSRPIPTKFVFGGSTGTADLQAKTIYLGSGTTSYITNTQYTGNAATATKATQDKNGNDITTKYVTMDTTQTITGRKTFSDLAAVTFKPSSGTDECNINYDSTLGALVFSF